MANWLDSLDLDPDDLRDGIILFCVLLLMTVFGTVMCYYVRKKKEENKKEEQFTEEAEHVFMFHEAPPSSQARHQGGPLACHSKACIFSLTGSQSCTGQPYTFPHQTPFYCQASPTVGVASQYPSVMLGAGQHTTTPLYPPSYFHPMPYDSTSSPDMPAPLPKEPPPPYEK